ncbi:hypothetical protein CDL12_15427 [Handroanthus impetiginosus]|uniref:Uncharacterized protein n=1 Tax=Handroanthus impetiginosus TaxID=429701 RepID=A0A2G9H375_9LAMI|nr:hypothetical protein CDL12_15427 [Handroanthus impetiginosus]
MHESSQTTNTKESQSSSSKTRRFTRLTVNREEKIEAEEHNAAVGENIQTKCVKLDTSAQNIIASHKCKLLTSPVDDKTSICSAGNEQSFVGEDEIIVRVDSLKGTFADGAEKHNYPKRLTRSAVREEAEKNKAQPKLKLSKSNSSESNKMDFVKRNVSAERNRLDIEKLLTSSISTKITEQFTGEREDTETFTHAKATPNIAESVSSSKCTKRKSASSQQQERRFSPRLRILPQTHSQNKA